MDKIVKVDISARAIIKVIVIIGTLYLMYLIRDIIALFFIVLILVAAFSPVVDKWSKKITRAGAVIAVISIIILMLFVIIALIIPPLINQSIILIQNIPDFLAKFTWVRDHIPEIKQSLSSLSSQIGNFSSGIITITTNIFGGIVTLITAFVLFIYLLLDEKNLKSFILSLFSDDKKFMVADVVKKIATKAGNWFRGQIMLCSIIAIFDLICLYLLGIPYFLTLAVISGMLEFIPTIGPIIAGAIAVLVALSVSPIKALLVIVLYVVVQQLENTFIVPKIMQKAVGLSPVVIIFAILIGAKLFGIIGVILSVPIAASLMVIVQDWPLIKKIYENQESLL